jgi:hypothetical protein
MNDRRKGDIMLRASVAIAALLSLALGCARSQAPTVSPEQRVDLLIDWVRQFHTSRLAEGTLPPQIEQIDYIVTHDVELPPDTAFPPLFFFHMFSRKGAFDARADQPRATYHVVAANRWRWETNVATLCTVEHWQGGETKHGYAILLWSESRATWGVGVSAGVPTTAPRTAPANR